MKNIVKFATNPTVLKVVGVGLLAFVLYKTKGFGYLKSKGQAAIKVEAQSDTVFVTNVATGQPEPQAAPLLDAGVANNIATQFHDTMGQAWDGLGSGWFGYSPSVNDYNDACQRLIQLSNQQLAQVVNIYAVKFKADTYNTVRKVLAEVSATTASCANNKIALLAKLTQINA